MKNGLPRHPIRSLLLLLLLLLSLSAVLPGSLTPQSDCSTCGGRGELACKRCPQGLEHGMQYRYCSVAAACASCAGALATGCRDCPPEDRREAERRIQERRRLAGKWLEARRAHLRRISGGKMGKLGSVLHCRTAHTDLVFAPGKSGNPHQQMHLCLQQIEDTRSRFMQVLGLKATDFPSQAAPSSTASGGSGAAGSPRPSPRLEVYVLRDLKDHRRVCLGVTGLVHQGLGVKRLGPRMVYALHHDLKQLPDEAALHRNLAHNVAHLLLSNMHPVGWIGEHGHGWLEAGLAHYFEELLGDGRCVNFCYLERAQQPKVFRGGRWRLGVRKMLAAGTLPAFSSTIGKDLSDLDFEEHALSFALVDYLIKALRQDGGRNSGRNSGKAKLASLIRAAKTRVPTQEAIKKVYGIELKELEKRFHQWIESTYPETEK